MAPDVPFMLQSWPEVIMHLDGDAFFASCEQSIHPELKGKPVLTGQERNIVASLSYEAKARGVKRGMPLWQVKQVCPDAIFLPSDYETYSLISKRMFSLVRSFTPDVEESSIDEGYADLKGLRRLYHKGYEGIARDIQQTIERELDITISVGVSVTKTLAKLAAQYKKPHGFTLVPGNHIHEFLRQIPVEDVCGIGPATTALLKKRRISTAYQFACEKEGEIKKLLGKIGGELWHEVRGTKIYPVVIKPKDTYQSISKTKTFTPPSSDKAYICAQLFRNVESACIKLRRYKLKTTRIIIFVREQDFTEHGLQYDLNRASASPQELFPFVEEMLEKLYRSTFYRMTGVVVTRLEEASGTQFDLFEDPLRMIAMDHVARCIDMINGRYGKHTVHAGTGLYLKQGRIIPEQYEGRHAVAARKTDLLPGETYRKRVALPVWKVRV